MFSKMFKKIKSIDRNLVNHISGISTIIADGLTDFGVSDILAQWWPGARTNNDIPIEF